MKSQPGLPIRKAPNRKGAERDKSRYILDPKKSPARIPRRNLETEERCLMISLFTKKPLETRLRGT